MRCLRLHCLILAFESKFTHLKIRTYERLPVNEKLQSK